METGKERNSSSSFTARVKTLSRQSKENRQNRARENCSRYRPQRLGNWSSLTLEQWEALAAVAATLPEYDRSR